MYTRTHTQADEHTLLLTPFEEGSLFRSFGDRRRIKHVDMRIMLSRALLHLHSHTHRATDGHKYESTLACTTDTYTYILYACIYSYGNKLLQCQLASDCNANAVPSQSSCWGIIPELGTPLNLPKWNVICNSS